MSKFPKKFKKIYFFKNKTVNFLRGANFCISFLEICIFSQRIWKFYPVQSIFRHFVQYQEKRKNFKKIEENPIFLKKKREIWGCENFSAFFRKFDIYPYFQRVIFVTMYINIYNMILTCYLLKTITNMYIFFTKMLQMG